MSGTFRRPAPNSKTALLDATEAARSAFGAVSGAITSIEHSRELWREGDCLLAGLRKGQSEGEDATLPQLADEPYFASVEFDEAFGER